MARVRNVGIAIILIHVIWYLAAIGINKAILPSPIVVYGKMPQLFQNGIVDDIYASLFRVFWGLLIATVIGVLVGILVVRLPKLGNILNPVLYFLYPIPKIAFLPILMLFLGIGEGSKLAILALANVFQVIISVRDQVRQIQPSLYEMLRVIDANEWDQFKYVTLPASIAGIISAMRIELSTSFAILFIIEAYGTQAGLGYYIMDEWSKMEYTQMYGGIVIISFLAFILFILLEAIDNYLNRWRN